jgi:hypothetical protein
VFVVLTGLSANIQGKDDEDQTGTRNEKKDGDGCADGLWLVMELITIAAE